MRKSTATAHTIPADLRLDVLDTPMGLVTDITSLIGLRGSAVPAAVADKQTDHAYFFGRGSEHEGQSVMDL